MIVRNVLKILWGKKYMKNAMRLKGALEAISKVEEKTKNSTIAKELRSSEVKSNSDIAKEIIKKRK